MTPSQAAVYYGVSSSTLRVWGDAGRLTYAADKRGHRRYVREEVKPRRQRMNRNRGVDLDFRERQALTLLAAGLSPVRAAASIPLHKRYFREILQQAREKLGADTTYQAVAIAAKNGLIEVKEHVLQTAQGSQADRSASKPNGAAGRAAFHASVPAGRRTSGG